MNYLSHTFIARDTKKLPNVIAVFVVLTALIVALSITSIRSASAAADTCTWTGATDANWSVGTNWSGCDNGGVPEDGDALVFPNSVSNKTNTNDLSGLDLTGISYTGDNYNTSGNAINLTGATTNVINFSGDFNAHGIPTTITASTSKAIAYTGEDNFIVSSLVLAFSSGDMNFSGATGVDLTVSSVISGTTGIFIVSPDSHLNLMNTNTFNKTAVSVNATSIMDCGADECFGNYTSGDVLNIIGGGQVYINSANTLDENITFSSGAGSPGQFWANADTTISGNTLVSSNGVFGVDGVTTLTVNGAISVDPSMSLQFQGDDGFQDNTVDLNGPFFGNGSVHFVDIEATVDSDNSLYSGAFNLQAGSVVNPGNVNAFGDSTTGTDIADGATLFVDDFFVFTEDFTITGAGVGVGNYLGAIVSDLTTTVFDEITLDGDATVANLSSGFTSSYRGIISGTGDLTFRGIDDDNAPFEIGGSGGADDAVASSYDGHTYVQGARLFLNKDAGVNAVPGDVSVVANTFAASLWLSVDDQVPDSATVSIDSAVSLGVLVVTSGTSETVGSVIGDGLIQIGSTTDELTVGGGDVSGVFNGSVSIPTGGTITKVGSGTWDFQGNNIDLGSGFGDYDVTAGRFLANPSDTSLENSTFTTSGTGTLGGDGNVGPVVANDGSVAPGNSPGCLYPAGPVTLASASSFDVELNGATSCTGYDQLNGGDTVTINSAQLNVSVGYTPVAGTQYTIIDADDVTGTFDGKPDGSTFTASGRVFEIDYTPTTVVLTDRGAVTTTVPAPSSTGTLPTTGAAALYFMPATGFALIALGAWLYRRKKYVLVKNF